MIYFQESGGEGGGESASAGGGTATDPVTSTVDDVTSGCFGSVILFMAIIGGLLGTTVISFAVH